MARPKSPFGLLLLCLAAILQVAESEIRPFTLLLEPASDYIHYVEGFLLAPGYIDLTNLNFWAVGNDGSDDDDTFNGDNRRLANDDDGSSAADGTAVDIAVFNLPASCDKSREGCDWVDLGIGARKDDELRYCCTNDAIDMGLCQGSQFGRLIMDSEKFKGKHRLITVPASGDYSDTLKYGRFEEKSGNGKYVVIFSNCNDEGRPVVVEGQTVWKSKHGYLPGDLFGLMYFLAAMFFVYFFMLLWYGITMKMYEDANIPIQSWIFCTIAMGCVELFFRTGDLFVWNEDGSRFWIAYYVGVIVGVLKRGISRCLIVMVSLGWGVVRDDLGAVMNKINLLGGIFIAVSLVRDIMNVVAYTEVQKISQEEEDTLFDIVAVLSLVIAVVDVIFFMWIIDAMNSTMEYLENMSQTSKLLRYLRLRMILLFSILFTVAYTIFGIVDSYDEGIVEQEQEWVLSASMEINYIFVLATVAILWRPQPNAKEYAYVMELPAMTADEDEFGEIGVELADIVPSAADLDDEGEK